jgi:hypothetical protein
LPLAGEDYYVAIWLRDSSSAGSGGNTDGEGQVTGKVGVALGTWVENFWASFDILTPSCSRPVGSDFSEEKNPGQASVYAAEFPY